MIRVFLFLLLIPCAAIAQNSKTITLEDIWSKPTFRQEMVTGFRSMKDGLHYTEINDGKLVKVRFQDGQEDGVILNMKDLKWEKTELKIDDYAFNADETKLLLFTESENIYRRSILNKVYIYDLSSKELKQLKSEKVLHATFSPLSDKVAYVYQQNLYYLDLLIDETVAVTDDGNYNILNGNCDWVYEEEFEFTRAYEWSPNGDFIAYYRFDQSAVPEYNFAIYDKLYPTDYKYKYPKAGEKNSEVSIHLYHLKNGKTVTCDLGEETDFYVPRIKMNPFNNSLIVFHLNRKQNHLELLQVNAKTGITDPIYNETNEYYIEINDDLHFLKNRNTFIYTSEKNGYRHLYFHDIEANRSTQITQGNWEVASVYGVDEKNNMLYYLSTENSPMERNLFKIQLNGEGKTNLTPGQGVHSIDFSEGFAYFMDKYSYINTPPTYSIRNSQGELIRTLKNNENLKKKMQEYGVSPLELIEVPTPQGVALNGWMIKPKDFNANKKYPLLMFQYSGPGSQQVLNQFGGRDFFWYQMLAQKGYIIVCVDGTGTGGRGESFKKKTYLQLGKYESDDQIEVAKYFAQQSYIDASRIGIWGWSFGGYMSSICILKGADVFKTAIAVAPVTNWRYYDNIYTERYMLTPKENAKGYDDNSPVNMVSKLKGNYLLIHGTADDNVHYQNALEMQKALIDANKDFDSEAYPNKNHGISGGVTRLHLYRRLTNYILEKL
ncbi:MAG: S9 family peptidase [Chitinophagaceae bacterium]|nr:S9 family peptidase [Chitinophagaceae bacterium]